MNYWKLDKSRNGCLPLFQYWMRKCQRSHGLIQYFNRFMLKISSFMYKCEIPYSVNIGPGLYIGHPYCITINPNAVIGKNCNIHKGVTIGQENRGDRKGTPKIGNEVWIGINSTIVGNIHIGDDVMIAPNSFINRDIPSHSLVFGNPCIIKHCDRATESYINNQV